MIFGNVEFEPIIKTKGLKILLIDGSSGYGLGEELNNCLLRNGSYDFKIDAPNEEDDALLIVEGEKDNQELVKKVKKESAYKGTAGFGSIQVMHFTPFKKENKHKDIEELKSCLPEADVVVCVCTGKIIEKDDAVGEALKDTCRSGKLVISCGYGNNPNEFVSGLISKDCKFVGDSKMGKDCINVIKFIAYKTNKGVLNSIRRNKVKTGVGLLFEEFLGQSLFRKSILGAVFGYNSNSKSRNVKDVTDKKNAKNEKGKKDNTVVQNAKK